ncbi:HlyD family efflux transporter periplasmic adaptor subunit [uncultured Clostridium sp.]|uniref:HlyD family efflux transporter periplasmic adaptor subunit n=1 Tax=uncultured Clostridium sp. TaxID=59620 RepID=UPI003459B9E5
MSSIQAQITDTNAQISALPNSYLTQINQQIQELNNQLTGIDASSTKNQGTKSLTKWQLVSQINQSLNSYKDKLQELKENIKQLNSQIKYGDITANASGTIYIPETPQIGMVLQAGQTIAQIMPSENKFEIKLMIPNAEVGNIKAKDEVKYSFLSFPYAEYGFVQGNLKTIGVTSELNPKTGLSYYSGTSTLSTDTISNKQGKSGTIKLGMACTAKIISRKEKMLYYILNQLGLKTNNI